MVSTGLKDKLEAERAALDKMITDGLSYDEIILQSRRVDDLIVECQRILCGTHARTYTRNAS